MAPMWRRFASILYDSFLIFSLYFFIAALIVTLNNGQAFDQSVFLTYVFRLGFLAAWVLFFSWFWSHGGQTLGMRAWKIKVVSEAGTNLTLTRAMLRFSMSLLSFLCLGIGYLWAVFDNEHYTLQDRLSKSKVVYLKGTEDF